MIVGEVNWIAIIVAAIVNMGIGWFWYSPAGFGKQWQSIMGMTGDKAKKMQEDGKKNMIWGLVASIVMVYVLSHIVNLTGASTIGAGIMTGLWIWLGFYATSQIGVVLWDGKPAKLYYINTAYSLVGLAVSGAILAVM